MTASQHTDNTLYDALIELDDRLVNHFSALKIDAKKQNRQTPLFLLEHGLGKEEIEHLKRTVRGIIKTGQLQRMEARHWLVFAVYTTEFGYSYDGHEYWPSFTTETPGWSTKFDNERVRTWGKKFASQYNGVTPKGRFANQFGIISWAIANAIIPRVHQHQLIKIISKIQNQISLRHLKSPESLGQLVARNVPNQAEQLKLFCANHQLIGEIIFSLLTHNTDTTGYLNEDAVNRIVSSLSAHTETRRLFHHAQRTAERIITRGFLPKARRLPLKTIAPVQPPSTHPTLLKLEKSSDKWRLRAELRPLRELNPQLAKDLEDKHDEKIYFEGIDSRGIKLSIIINSGFCLELYNLPGSTFQPITDTTLDSDTTAILQSTYLISLEHPLVFKAVSGRTAEMIHCRGANPGSTYLTLFDRIESGLPRMFGTMVKTSLHRCNCLQFELSRNPSPQEVITLFKLRLFLRTHITISANADGDTKWDGRGTAHTRPGAAVTFNLSGLTSDARLLVSPPVEKELAAKINIIVHSQSSFTVAPSCQTVFHLPINMRRASTATQELIGLVRVNTASSDNPPSLAQCNHLEQLQGSTPMRQTVETSTVRQSTRPDPAPRVTLVTNARTTTALLSSRGTFIVARPHSAAKLVLHHSSRPDQDQPLASSRIEIPSGKAATSRHIAKLIVVSKIVHRTPKGTATLSISVDEDVLARQSIIDDLTPARTLADVELYAALRADNRHSPKRHRRHNIFYHYTDPFTPRLLPKWLTDKRLLPTGLFETRGKETGIHRIIISGNHTQPKPSRNDRSTPTSPDVTHPAMLINSMHAIRAWYFADTYGKPGLERLKENAQYAILHRIAEIALSPSWNAMKSDFPAGNATLYHYFDSLKDSSATNESIDSFTNKLSERIIELILFTLNN